jgi:hypothetical protein
MILVRIWGFDGGGVGLLHHPYYKVQQSYSDRNLRCSVIYSLILGLQMA